MALSTSALEKMLDKRVNQGKEDRYRLQERKGITTQQRPPGKLVWLHAASVGEAQSALILINEILDQHKDIHILMTTGTLTSARLMEQRLPERTIHQFIPVDHPKWVESFFNYWKPNMALWMESELWPSMLYEVKKRKIPAALINARMSMQSRTLWTFGYFLIARMLSGFNVILAQTGRDAGSFKSLGGKNVINTGNLKYSAKPLSSEKEDLEQLQQAINGRPVWVYASTHNGEEEIACRVHQILKSTQENLLTIIAPRHPERGGHIARLCRRFKVKASQRTRIKKLPKPEDEIFVVDTIGELGLFYHLTNIACIGRSFSDDGGGGHNPIEAAQLNCAILHGPKVQNFRDVYDEMDRADAAVQFNSKEELFYKLKEFMSDPALMKQAQEKSLEFTKEKERVLQTVMDNLAPVIDIALGEEKAPEDSKAA